MANGTLTNNTGTLTFTDQKNIITLATQNTFVDSNITLTTKVDQALLNTDSSDADHKTFTIQIPNGDSNDILLVFTTDTNGNTLVTGSNVTQEG